MGWNQISFNDQPDVLEGIPDKSWFYFVHSYYVEPREEGIGLITTEYGIRFTAAIQKDNIFACQFHPEKSSDLGLKILGNFGSICN